MEEYVEENYAGASYRQLRKTKILADLEKNGTGISFLPIDIDSLHKSLRLLLGEFKAGNRATRNEIVSIVNNLFERNKISKNSRIFFRMLVIKPKYMKKKKLVTVSVEPSLEPEQKRVKFSEPERK